jgi:hypothetical protein
MRGKNRTKKKGGLRAVPFEGMPQDGASTAKRRECVTAIPKLICTEAFAVPFADEVDMASISDVLTCEISLHRGPIA